MRPWPVRKMRGSEHLSVSGISEFPFRDMFKADDKNTYYDLINIKEVFSKFMIS